MLLVGLPIEENLDIQEEINKLKNEYDIRLDQIVLPDFIHLNISSCSSHDDTLSKAEKDCIDLIKGFSKIKMINYNQTCQWDTTKYPSVDIEECLKMITEDLQQIKTEYTSKKDENLKYKKESERIRKRTSGNILERDINYPSTDYEFLEEIYVVVEKEMTTFDEFIKNSESASEETIEKLEEDEKYILYKILILKVNVKSFKKECQVKGFYIKESNPLPLPVIEPDGLDLFVDTYYLELYQILIHLKLLKLFIESFLRYGLPKSYVFLRCTGEKVLEKMKKISEKWKSERIMEESDEDEPDDNFAYTFIETYIDY